MTQVAAAQRPLARPESVTLIEHDTLPTKAGYQSLVRCRQSAYCTLPYPSSYECGLGAVRFSARLMREFPDVLGK